MKFSLTEKDILLSAETLLRERGNLPGKWTLRIDPALKEEEYCVTQENGLLSLSGGTAPAVVFGAGRLIREPDFRGSSAPDKPFRGIYFATHFGNWYDHAPEKEIDRYLEDLAIWGCNAVKVWFDRHHFRNIMERAARKKLERLKHIFRKSASLGMKTFLTSLANEAYAGSPEALRADWTGGKNGYRVPAIGGHYHVELCPSRPGAVDLLLHWHEEMLDAFAGIPIHYFEIFSYDQGGCTCEECAPYGANGYWKIIPRLSDLIRRKYPSCKVVVSTWRFDSFTSGEWENLRSRKELGKYADMLSLDNGDVPELKKFPRRMPAMGFTDISMGRQLPWGGYGANPCPTFLETLRGEPYLDGNSAYSEGIYEDMNKIILLGEEWDSSCSAWTMVRKYARFHFGKETPGLVEEIVRLLEGNLNHSAIVTQNGGKYSAYATDQVDPGKPWSLDYAVPAMDKKRAERCLELVMETEKRMDEEKRGSWRWKIIRLRAEIDFALARGDDPGNAMRKLSRIYRCAEDTLPCLLPPARTTWREIIAQRRNSLV
ncbi:MAG: hypothetical protein J6331_04640 [Lentisphaeria bacterium]|nr:hypothetical protein [Lentisphaeria bacterium]